MRPVHWWFFLVFLLLLVTFNRAGKYYTSKPAAICQETISPAQFPNNEQSTQSDIEMNLNLISRGMIRF